MNPIEPNRPLRRFALDPSTGCSPPMNPAEACSPAPAALVPNHSPLAPRPAPLILWGAARLAASAPPLAAWLWQGYLAPGAVTLLTSRWKAGKTTLASVLLARLGA